MDPQLIQNYRYKLQKRVRRLNSVSYAVFQSTLKQFWVFFDSTPTLVGIGEQLTARFPDVSRTVDEIFNEKGLAGETDEESAAIGQEVLRRFSSNGLDRLSEIAWQYGFSGGKLDETLETIRDIFLEPFYEYVDEHLDDQRAMLALLLRYKHRCEWFHRNRLFDLAQADSRKAEKSLALDLYAYLYDQGIDFTIEPSSLTGEIDLIAAQGSPDPLLVDTKIFDAAGRGRAYICKGFNQIYTYSQQYNEPFGYLVIFKLTDKDLRLSLSVPSGNIPVVVYNHKTIFLLTVDIYPYPKPVSQRDPISAVEIKEENLIQAAQEEPADPTSATATKSTD